MHSQALKIDAFKDTARQAHPTTEAADNRAGTYIFSERHHETETAIQMPTCQQANHIASSHVRSCSARVVERSEIKDEL